MKRRRSSKMNETKDGKRDEMLIFFKKGEVAQFINEGKKKKR